MMIVRGAGQPRQFVGDERRLVEPARPEPPAVQRHRNHRIGLGERDVLGRQAEHPDRVVHLLDLVVQRMRRRRQFKPASHDRALQCHHKRDATALDAIKNLLKE